MVENGNNQINNLTLENISKKCSLSSRNISKNIDSTRQNCKLPNDKKMKGHDESLLDVSDLSFDDNSENEILVRSKPSEDVKNLCSANVLKPPRRSFSMASNMSLDSILPNTIIERKTKIEKANKKEFNNALQVLERSKPIEKKYSSNIFKSSRRSFSMSTDKITHSTSIASVLPNSMMDLKESIQKTNRNGLNNALLDPSGFNVNINFKDDVNDTETKIEKHEKEVLKEMMKKKRESFNPQKFKASVSNMEPSDLTAPWLTSGSILGVNSTLPHNFQEKKAFGSQPRCGPCDKRIKFSKSYFACQDCNLVCHTNCRENVEISCLKFPTTTKTVFESPMIY